MFDFVNKMLDGYKTKIAMVGATVAFIGFVLNLVSDGVQAADWQPFITAFSVWMGGIGLGHKAVKIETTLKK